MTTPLDRLNFLASKREIRALIAEMSSNYRSTVNILKKLYVVKLQLCPNWTDSNSLHKQWAKMLLPSHPFELTTTDPDFWIIINAPNAEYSRILRKTIVMRMEPWMEKNSGWGEWSTPDSLQYKRVITHSTHLNPIEWHLSKSARELLTDTPIKDPTLAEKITVILSEKYSDEGHIKRVNFLNYFERLRPTMLHIYGTTRLKWNDNKGALPYACKEIGLYSYKYTFAAENNAIPNYITEKLIDAILSECLCFYWGAPNSAEWIDSRAFIQLSLTDFEQDAKIVTEAIANQEWEKRIHIIRTEKCRIINDLSMFSFIQNLL